MLPTVLGLARLETDAAFTHSRNHSVFESESAKHLRTSVSSLYDMVTVMTEALNEFGVDEYAPTTR